MRRGGEEKSVRESRVILWMEKRIMKEGGINVEMNSKIIAIIYAVNEKGEIQF